MSAEEIKVLMNDFGWKESTLKINIGASRAEFIKLIESGTSNPVLVKRINALKNNHQIKKEFNPDELTLLMKSLDMNPNDLACFVDVSRSAVGKMLSENDEYEVPAPLRKLLKLIAYLKKDGYDAVDIITRL